MCADGGEVLVEQRVSPPHILGDERLHAEYLRKGGAQYAKEVERARAKRMQQEATETCRLSV